MFPQVLLTHVLACSMPPIEVDMRGHLQRNHRQGPSQRYSIYNEHILSNEVVIPFVEYDCRKARDVLAQGDGSNFALLVDKLEVGVPCE